MVPQGYRYLVNQKKIEVPRVQILRGEPEKDESILP